LKATTAPSHHRIVHPHRSLMISNITSLTHHAYACIMHLFLLHEFFKLNSIHSMDFQFFQKCSGYRNLVSTLLITLFFARISSRPAGSMDRASAFGIVIPLDRSIAEGSGFESQVGRFFCFVCKILMKLLSNIHFCSILISA
jgi:hypothetical protein